MHYLFLALAVVAEILGSSALKPSEGFTKLWPSVLVVVGFVAVFLFVSQALRSIPLSVAYAIWAGAGTARTILVGVLLFKESFDMMKLAGVVAILFGVVLLNLRGGH